MKDSKLTLDLMVNFHSQVAKMLSIGATYGLISLTKQLISGQKEEAMFFVTPQEDI